MNLRRLMLLTEHYFPSYLTEGGAMGHIYHLYDNRDLTFGELKDVLNSAAEGKLEKVTEKCDGMNLVFTWADGLKVARGKSDIKTGGMDAAALAQKFAGHNSKTVEEAFNGAFKVLNDAIGSLSEQTMYEVFENGAIWYSIEVIYSKNPNVINYDKDCIVFHNSPVFRIYDDGRLGQDNDAPGVAMLQQNIERMQRAITMKSWQVRGPVMMRLQRLSDGSIVERALNAIEQAQNAGGVDDDGTIGEYLHNIISEEVADLGLEADVASKVTARIVGLPGAPGLPEIKKMVPKETYPVIKAFVDRQKTLMKHAIMPIEHAIHAFAIELLRGLHSALVADNVAEVARLRQQVAGAVKALEGSTDANAMNTLAAHLTKMGSTDNIVAAMEGIVFIYKGAAYKFTGSFAPMNQILGMFKYGRGGTKIEQEELQRAVKRIVGSRPRVERHLVL